MSNTKSHLHPGVVLSILSSVLFFLCAIAVILESVWAWFAPIMLLISILFFIFKSGSFIRECTIQMLYLSLIALLSWAILHMGFGSISGSFGTLFRIIDWIIRSLSCLAALISGVIALNGERFKIPGMELLVSKTSKALGVY